LPSRRTGRVGAAWCGARSERAVKAFYNLRRRHTSIGDLSPVEFEARSTAAEAAAR
jgi:transposase InsO family protein